MRKYLFLLKNQVSLVAAYRFEMVSRWIMSAFDTIVYVALWSLAAQGDPEQIRKVFLYFVLFYGILHGLQTGKVAKWMAEDISSGQLNQYLVRPINFPLVQVIKSVTVLIVRSLVPALIIAVGILVLPDYFAPVGVPNLILAILFALLGLVLWNLFMILMGTAAFWVTEIDSLLTVVDLTLNLFKGAYIPAFLFPAQVSRILSFTPIPYLSAFPIAVYQQPITTSTALFSLAIIGSWGLALGLLAALTYRKGLEHYEAVGG